MADGERMRQRRVVLRWGSSLITSALLSTLLVLTGSAAPVAGPAVAAAGSTYLCSGYSGCRSAGYSDSGYGAVNDRMYWRMYSGHNCTNYVAYRIIRAGGPASRPWSGGGNASEWGKYMSRITDQVPNVGAVAWWGRYSNGSGSAGHVAYVEKVVSANEIIISEDSWGGTFHWRRITKSSGRWPTGFIHFVDKMIKPVAAPVVTGTPQVGTPLTVSTGRWSIAPAKYGYQWFADGVPVAGATAASYTPAAAEVGKRMTVRVVARRGGYTNGVQTATTTADVVKGVFEVTEPPTVTGTPYVDEVLSVTPGAWRPANERPSWRWYADGVFIRDNYGPTLTLTPALVGKTIKVVPVARATAGYRNTRASALDAGTVLMGEIEVARPFARTGIPRIGETLTIRRGSYTPADATVGYRWLRDGTPIPGAGAASYRLTGADVGRRISAEVTLTRRNYAPWTQDLPATRPIVTPSAVRLVTDGRSHRAIVRVRVVAPGLSEVPGTVAIRIGRWREEVRLVDGRARVAVRLPYGRKDVVVRYLGLDSGPWRVITRAKASDTVLVD